MSAFDLETACFQGGGVRLRSAKRHHSLCWRKMSANWSGTGHQGFGRRKTGGDL